MGGGEKEFVICDEEEMDGRARGRTRVERGEEERGV